MFIFPLPIPYLSPTLYDPSIGLVAREPTCVWWIGCTACLVGLLQREYLVPKRGLDVDVGRVMGPWYSRSRGGRLGNDDRVGEASGSDDGGKRILGGSGMDA